MLVSRAIARIGRGTPTKFPSGATTENDVGPLSPPPHILPVPQKGTPPNRTPTKRDAPFPDPSNYLLKFPVNRLRRFRQRAPMEGDTCLPSFLLPISSKVPGKCPPPPPILHVHQLGTLWREKVLLQIQCFILSLISVRRQAHYVPNIAYFMLFL